MIEPLLLHISSHFRFTLRSIGCEWGECDVCESVRRPRVGSSPSSQWLSSTLFEFVRVCVGPTALPTLTKL